MHTQHVAEAPVHERGGQSSYLLLQRGKFGSQNLAKDGLLVDGSAAEPQACRLKADCAEVQAGLLARLRHTALNRGDEFGAATLDLFDVVRRPATSVADNVSTVIADERSGARLTAIHPQPDIHGRQPATPCTCT